jgi:hypothetical protein
VNDNQFSEFLGLMRAQNHLLGSIVECLSLMTQAQAPDSPNFRRSLPDFPGFDWGSIGADVVARDHDGVAVVSWKGQEWKRRSGAGKFGQAIWFSRPVGKDESGENQYYRLITFKEYEEPEALPDAVARTIAAANTIQIPATVPAPPAPQPVRAVTVAATIAPPMPQHQAIPPVAAKTVEVPAEIPQNPRGLLALVQKVAPDYATVEDMFAIVKAWPKFGDAAGWQAAYLKLINGG